MPHIRSKKKNTTEMRAAQEAEDGAVRTTPPTRRVLRAPTLATRQLFVLRKWRRRGPDCGSRGGNIHVRTPSPADPN